jgi:hypothetical protein
MEGLVAMSGLLALYGAISWLGRYQDMALQATHASRYAAFSLARNRGLRPVGSIRRHYFSGPAHQWARPDGLRIFDQAQTQLKLSVSGERLAADALPGGMAKHAVALRQGLKLDGPGLYHAFVSIRFADSGAPGHHRFVSYPALVRNTAILVDAGHAGDDSGAQQRVAQSGPGWRDIAGRSQALGRRIASYMVPVDSAWERDAPDFDWLVPWAGHVPGFHLGRHGAGQ